MGTVLHFGQGTEAPPRSRAAILDLEATLRFTIFFTSFKGILNITRVILSMPKNKSLGLAIFQWKNTAPSTLLPVEKRGILPAE